MSQAQFYPSFNNGDSGPVDYGFLFGTTNGKTSIQI